MSENLESMIREEVRRAAASLDSVKPRWWEHVDVATLDFSSNEHCLLGQVFANDVRDWAKTGFDVACGTTNLVTTWPGAFVGTGLGTGHAIRRAAWAREILVRKSVRWVDVTYESWPHWGFTPHKRSLWARIVDKLRRNR